MSIEIKITCDKCGHKMVTTPGIGSNVSNVKVKDVARFFSFYDIPLTEHICFNCATEVLDK